MIQRQRPLACEPVHEPVGALDDTIGRGVDTRLVSLQPQCFGKHPFRRHDAGDVTEDRITGRADFFRFPKRSLIHPEQCATQRRAVDPAGENSAGGTIKTDAGHGLRFGPRSRQGFGYRGAGRLPPLQRVLLRPARLGMKRIESRRGERLAVSAQVEEGGPQTLRADVQTEKKRLTGAHESISTWNNRRCRLRLSAKPQAAGRRFEITCPPGGTNRGTVALPWKRPVLWNPQPSPGKAAS